MTIACGFNSEDFELTFKVFHRLMPNRVHEILLVSSPYDAFIMEEDGRLAERIIHEYRGLNLTRPPMLTWVNNSREALKALSGKRYDLLISMPRLDDIEPLVFGREIKKVYPNLPFFLMVHPTSRLIQDPRYTDRSSIDKLYVWGGNTDLLLALIKNLEDRMNVEPDTEKALVRVIILVEDSPRYLSSLLPLLYREIVTQTQAVMEESINAEHRMLRMRARPKILVAETFEEAVMLFEKYKPYLLSVFSDVRFPRAGKPDDQAGVSFLSYVKERDENIPLLLFSSDESNRKMGEKVSAMFLNKNSVKLHSEISSFFVQYLGFGDFVFKLPDGREIDRVSNLRSMEKVLPKIPVDSVYYHARRNHFSSWLMARSEIKLASRLKPLKAEDFPSPDEIKEFLLNCIHERRRGRQKGMITDFGPDFDPEADFIKIGKGSLGGKARSLAFMAMLLKQTPALQEKYETINIRVPRILAITTEHFEEFLRVNELMSLATENVGDEVVQGRFLDAMLPDLLRKDLKRYIEQVKYPLAVRSSILLEDAQYEPFAGIYRTYMLPNNDKNFNVRFKRILQAIKLVFASTYLKAPKAYAKTTMHRIEEEKMAVILQQLIGRCYGNYFFPAISGVVQSHNFYPIGRMKSEDGLVHLAMGLGKTVVEGGTALRFSPKFPQYLPQFSTVDDILKNAQRYFWSLDMSDFPQNLSANDGTLKKMDIDEVNDSFPQNLLASTYIPQEHRIRDSAMIPGYKVLTFAGILKHGLLPLPELLFDLAELAKSGLGSPVEIEFAVDLPEDKNSKPELAVLQLRPMSSSSQIAVEISEKDIRNAFCYSTMALGLQISSSLRDIVYVKPDSFDPGKTVEVAAEISKVNRRLRDRKSTRLNSSHYS